MTLKITSKGTAETTEITIKPIKKGTMVEVTLTFEKEWEVWSEGYYGKHGNKKAILCFECRATTFKEAVYKYLDFLIEQGVRVDTFDLENLTFSGCRFFDNEKDARERFG